MSAEACASEFIAVTVDDAKPIGDRNTYPIDVDIDCTPPVLVKEVGVPKIAGDTFDWWVRQDTLIELSASDSIETDECNLGVDYCRYMITVDGVAPADWTYVENGPELVDWSFYFTEDSEHFLEVECYDNAGNKVVLTETDKVDSTPPETTKKYDEPSYPDDINTEGAYPHFITTQTPIWLTPVDPEAEGTPAGVDCSIGVEKTWYYDVVVPNELCESQVTCEKYTACPSPYEPCACKQSPGVECVEKAQSQCQNIPGVCDDYWGDMKFESPEACVAGTDWANCVEFLVNNWCVDCSCSSNWQLLRYDVNDDPMPIFKPEESCHIIQFFSVDYIGNMEPMQRQCVYVENTPPKTTKEIGDPKVIKNDNTYITTETPIILTCEELGPHPTGETTINYRYRYATECSGLPDATWSQWIAYTDAIHFIQDSCHQIEYYCVDALGNTEVTQSEIDIVDTKPPVSEKVISDPKKECTNEEQEKFYGESEQTDGCYFITPQTQITLTCTDELPHPVGDTELYYRYYLAGNQPPGFTEVDSDTEDNLVAEVTISIPEESAHILEWYCEDELNRGETHIEFDNVDTLPPVTTKTYGKPHYPEVIVDGQYPHWITSETPVTLAAEDVKVGVDKIYWRDLYLLGHDEVCNDEPIELDGEIGLTDVELTGCNPYYYSQLVADYDTLPWNEYTEEFTKEPESCHVIEYKAVDLLGNEEIMKWQCVFVDDTAPKGTKVIGEPKLTCVAPEEPEETVLMAAALTALPERTGDIYEAPMMAMAAELLDAVDPCSLVTQGATQCAYVDASEAAQFVKDTMIAQGADPANCGNVLVLSSGDPADADYYLSTSMSNSGCGINPDGFGTNDCVILPGYQPEENSVALAISSEWPEYAHTTYTDWMQIGGVVDMSINSWSGLASLVYMPAYGPSASGSVTLATLAASQSADLRVADSGDSIYDTAIIVVPLSCFEEAPTPQLCGNNKVEPGEECDDGNTQNGDGCSSVCLIETGPVQPDCWWVSDHVTEVTMSCTDKLPHPVAQENLCYKVSFDEDEVDGYITDKYCEQFGGEMTEDGWCCQYVGDSEGKSYTLTFQEDSVHDLEYYCTDGLGNENSVDKEYFRVDSTPPVTTKEYTGPFYVDPETRYHYIDTASKVKLTATDGGEICHVDGVKTSYRYRIVDDSLCEDAKLCLPNEQIDQAFTEYTEEFGIPDESCHIIEFYSVDALGNIEPLKAQCVFVDKSPPVITKEYGKPYFTEDGKEWITSSTPITIGVTDPEPHPSGVKEVQYRVTVMGGNEACESKDACQAAEGSGAWSNLPEGPIYIAEDSCHLIEVTAKDNVDKTSTHKQCVFVDNKAPLPNKTVEEPKTRWDGADANFYEIADICKRTDEVNSCLAGTGCIDCWRVTLDTEINLDCVDQQPHPVDHNGVCFKVDVDGSDFTEKYCCNKWDKECNYYNEETGYCCLPQEEKQFRFKEETEHNLAYYCVDALGNAGPVDDEKFKVGGKAFELPLCKKWNLVSVPFVLLDDSPAAVFKDTTGVEAVWGYDGEQWKVWTPAEDGLDTLTSIEPGYGYWVLETGQPGCEKLVLGGSLFDTLAAPPSVDLVKGWNLVGYYGTTPKEEAYCSLNSLIDTQEGYPRWSSLWMFSNKNCKQCEQAGCGMWGWGGWTGLDVCDKMSPGRGYWIEIDVEDKYAPASVCIWNKDFPELQCVNQGGWIN